MDFRNRRPLEDPTLFSPRSVLVMRVHRESIRRKGLKKGFRRVVVGNEYMSVRHGLGLNHDRRRWSRFHMSLIVCSTLARRPRRETISAKLWKRDAGHRQTPSDDILGTDDVGW